MHLGCWQAPASAPGCGHLQGLQGWQVEDLVPQQRDRKRQERERTKTGGVKKDDGDEVEKILWAQSSDENDESEGERRGRGENPPSSLSCFTQKI